MIKNDEEALKAIKIICNANNLLDEEEEAELLLELENFQIGCWNIISTSSKKLSAEEILKKAREMNKPILL